MPTPEILIIAPPPIQKAKGTVARKFLDAEKKSLGLNEAIQEVANDSECHFFDAGSVTETSTVDGVHLDENQHLQLGIAVAVEVKRILQLVKK